MKACKNEAIKLEEFAEHFIKFYLSVPGVESITLKPADYYETVHLLRRYQSQKPSMYVDIRGEEVRICGIEIKKGERI